MRHKLVRKIEIIVGGFTLGTADFFLLGISVWCVEYGILTQLFYALYFVTKQ
ncbi:Uncharacterised protein [Vibrio cholerae]|nr:Uncharacterised protein [Vibrio cholerae]